MTDVTAPPATGNDLVDVWAPRCIVAVIVAALVLVTIDAGGPLRNVVAALALLVAPGLAASVVMGAMSVEARALISVAGSAALLTVVALVMALLGSWSPTVGLWIVSVVAGGLLLVSFRRTKGGRLDHTAQDDEPDRTTETSSRHRGDIEHEGGGDHDR